MVQLCSYLNKIGSIGCTAVSLSSKQSNAQNAAGERLEDEILIEES